MPLYNFLCTKCNYLAEYFVFGYDESVPCECCFSAEHQVRQISLPSKHSSWHSTGRYGANGYFSKALGRYVDSPQQAQNILEKQGFVCEADLPKHRWDDATEKHRDTIIQQETYIQTYKDKLASGKSKEEAVAETFTAQDALSGKLEQTFKGETI